MSHKTTTAEKYWAKVRRASDEQCWPWLGSKTHQGYGTIHVGSTTRRAHVIGWEIKHGRPFPDGMFGLHRCDNPSCVNPHHIFPGTHGDNMRDMVAKRRHVNADGKRPSGQRLHIGGLCRNGHLLAANDIVDRGRFSRACRLCLKVQWKKARDARKARRAAA